MKNKLTKLISFLLVLASLVSMSAVFAFAEEGDEAVEESGIELLYYRTYDEGWTINNGLGMAVKGNVYDIDSEVTMDFKRNYFWRFTLESGQDGYAEMNLTSSSTNYMIEFDVKSDDYAHAGRVMYVRTANSDHFNVFHIKNNKAYGFDGTEEEYLFDITDTWHTVSVSLDGERYGDEPKIHANMYVDGELKLTKDITIKGAKWLQFIRIGCSAGNSADLFGATYCLDNVKAYAGTATPIEITPEMGHGVRVNENATKTVEIEGVESGGDVKEQMLAMKIGVDHFYSKGERLAIFSTEDGVAYGAPVKVDGKVMVPLDPLLDHMGVSQYVHADGKYIDISTGLSSTYLCIGKDSATVDGKRVELSVAPGYVTPEVGEPYIVIAMDDIEALFSGWYITYDPLGLIIFCQKDEVYNRDAHSEVMMEIMSEFIFEFVTPEEAYEDAVEGTDNFSHPYIMGNQEDFDYLREVYNSVEGDEVYNPELKKLITNYVNQGINSFKRYAAPSSLDDDGAKQYDEYVGLLNPAMLDMPYPDSYGYDPDGGRSNPGTHTEHLDNLAFAYMMTLDEKYVLCANDVAYEMGEWLHWGHGHFLNCADGSYPYAMFFDWCYNINEEIGARTGEDINKKLATILYRQGVYHGWRSSMDLPMEGQRIHGDASMYDRVNNWNAVCTAGMVTSALAIMEYEEFREHSTFLVSHNIHNLATVGMVQYMPDGAYIEGPGYWAYGTNSFFRLCKVLDVALGTNYGLMDCWGMDKTCYYACSTESSDFRTFNYHDGSMGSQDTSWFFYAGEALGDPNLITIRETQIANGKGGNVWDMFCWPEEKANGDVNSVPLDYIDYTLELYTSRDSWEKGAMFVGIMAGNNNVTHGQIDAGSFVYHNDGTVWFIDIGTENYNCHGFWAGGTRYRYYRMNPEGNNTLALTSAPKDVPYGQVLNSIPVISDYGENEHGSFVTYDMTEAFGKHATSWTRGVMVTNDRETVVIQDEVAFSSIQDVYWFGHFSYSYITDIKLSNDGRTAYFSHVDTKTGEKIYLRASIVSNYKKFKFEIMDCYTFVNNNPDWGILSPDYALSNGTSVPEYDRSGFGKLAIKGEAVLSFNVAVALEALPQDSDMQVGYKWTTMDKWKPTEDTRTSGIVDDSINIRNNKPNRTEILSGVARLKRFFEDENVYKTGINDLYRVLADVQYVLSMYKDNITGQNYIDAKNSHAAYVTDYETFISKVNTRANDGYSLAKRLTAMN